MEVKVKGVEECLLVLMRSKLKFHLSIPGSLVCNKAHRAMRFDPVGGLTLPRELSID